MPEGPEVKLFVDKLDDKYKGKTIKKINILSGRFLKKNVDFSVIDNKLINSINCKGKFIWFDLGELVLFNTLGMSGSWGTTKSNHSRLEFEFKDSEERLYFTDIRSFGTLDIKNKVDLVKKLKSIGPDMLSNPPTSKEFIDILRKKPENNICVSLMSQNIISGVGNYIKAETLWLSCINPFAKIKDLTDDNLNTLYYAILFVIRSSYVSQGATLKSYYTFDDEKGSYGDFLYVYGKKRDYNNYKVIKSETPDKRSTHYVKERQVIGQTSYD